MLQQLCYCLLLSITDGIPSPAADLHRIVPWEQAIDRDNSDRKLHDVTHQMQPWLIYLRNEVREGRLPFWNPYQYSGKPYWSKSQGAPLYPLNLIFIILPLQLGLVILPWLKIVVSGLGVWLLARELGIGQRGSILASLIFPLSGLPIAWIFAPVGSTMLLCPWVLWSVERIANGRGGWQELSLIAGIQFFAGHPQTVVHTAMISGLYLLIRGSTRSFYRTWGVFLVGWTLALAISAVCTLPFLYTVFESSKWLNEPVVINNPLFPHIKLLALGVRFVLPQFFGHPVDGTWWGVGTYTMSAVYSGAVATILAAAMVTDFWKKRKLLALAVILILCTLIGYTLPGPYTILQSLPIIENITHHRLRFGMALALAVLAGFGFERWLEGRARGILFGASIITIFLIIAWAGVRRPFTETAWVWSQLTWTFWVFGTALFLSVSLVLKPKFRNYIWPLIPILLVIDLVAAHGRINPGLSVSDFYPSTPAIEFLNDKPGRIAGVDDYLRPNAAMVYNLYDIRGDDVLKLDRYEKVYSELSNSYDPVYFKSIQNWDSPWLSKLGVRWVIDKPNAIPKVPEWKRVYHGEDASVFELENALPIVRWQKEDVVEHDSNASLIIEQRNPGYWKISWHTSSDQKLIVAETWDKGWRAKLSTDPDNSFTPERIDDILMGINVSAGSGQLEIKYIPQGLYLGLMVSVLGLIILLAGTYYRIRKNRVIKL